MASASAVYRGPAHTCRTADAVRASRSGSGSVRSAAAAAARRADSVAKACSRSTWSGPPASSSSASFHRGRCVGAADRGRRGRGGRPRGAGAAQQRGPPVVQRADPHRDPARAALGVPLAAVAPLAPVDGLGPLVGGHRAHRGVGDACGALLAAFGSLLIRPGGPAERLPPLPHSVGECHHGLGPHLPLLGTQAQRRHFALGHRLLPCLGPVSPTPPGPRPTAGPRGADGVTAAAAAAAAVAGRRGPPWGGGGRAGSAPPRPPPGRGRGSPRPA